MAFESSAPIVNFKDLPESFPDDVEIGKLGHGFNIVDGAPRASPFTLVTALYSKGKGVEEGFTHFKDFLDYERGATTMMGLSYQPGMVGLDCGTRTTAVEDPDGAIALPPQLSPFLSNIEKLDSTVYNFFGFEVEVFALTVTDFNHSRIANSKKVKAIQNLDFNTITKKQFFAIIDKYGTHYIHKARYGVKAEMRWMIRDMKDKPKSSTSLQDVTGSGNKIDEINQKFKEIAHKWKSEGFPAMKDLEGILDLKEEQVSYSQQVRCTPFLHTLLSQISRKKPIQLGKTPQMISYQAKELSELFTGKLADQMRLAIQRYISERKPLRLEDLEDGSFVWIRCMDNGHYIRTDSSGALRCDAKKAAPGTDTQFQIRKKNDKIALKSVLYNRMVSRANTRPLFRFAYLPVSILGPHETFTISGDYLLVHSHLHSPRYLYIGEDNVQILPDGTTHLKNRFCIFSQCEGPENVSSDDLVEQEVTEDPSFPMKSPLVLELTHRKHTTPGFSEVISPRGESSTSSDVPMVLSNDVRNAAGTSIPASSATPFASATTPTSSEVPAPHGQKAVSEGERRIENKYPAHLSKRKSKLAAVHKPSKFNSTSSLYIRDSINAPDLKVLSRCIAIAISYHINAGHEAAEKKFFDIFDEEKHPIYAKKAKAPDFSTPPTVDDVFTFVNQIFVAMKLSAECGIMALAYVERVIKKTGLTLHARNWRRVVLCAFILASKVWEELAIWNVDFLSIFPNLTVKDLNTMEKQFLMYLQYNVSLKASLYTKYFFELADLAESPREFPLRPMDKTGLDMLERRSLKTEDEAMKLRSKKRAQSLDLTRTEGSEKTPATNTFPRAVLS